MATETKIDEVVEELYQRISQGMYNAGERLPAERDLAEELHVSRQTVHSAMLRLQTENHIDIRPRDGAFVRAPAAKVLIGPAAPSVVGKNYTSLLTSALQMQK